MATYHINDEGNVGPCSAQIRCPFGSPSEHYDTPEAARRAYENRSSTFDSSKLLRKKQHLATTNFNARSGLNQDGLTDNMEEYQRSLNDLGNSIKHYAAYRRTGLDELSHRPKVPDYLRAYVSAAVSDSAWQRQDYKLLRGLYTEAITNYYMENVFDDDDIDVMLSDDQIERLTNQPDLPDSRRM